MLTLSLCGLFLTALVLVSQNYRWVYYVGRRPGYTNTCGQRSEVRVSNSVGIRERESEWAVKNEAKEQNVPKESVVPKSTSDNILMTHAPKDLQSDMRWNL